MSFREIITKESTDPQTGIVKKETTFIAGYPYAVQATEDFEKIITRIFSDQKLEITSKRYIDGASTTVTTQTKP